MSREPKEDLTREEENMLYWAGVIALPIGLFCAYAVVNWIVPNFQQTECLFWYLWGVYCPGCGGTRALTSLLHGDFLLSLWYHPIILYFVVLYALYMISHTLAKFRVPFIKAMRFRVWYMYGALIIIGVNFVLKNVLKFCFGIAM